MKLKNISVLLIFLFVFSYVGLAQEDDEEIQMFSVENTRGLKTNLHDFGTIEKNSTPEYKIEIKAQKHKLLISDVYMSKGVSILLLKKIIRPGKKGIVVVKVHPEYMKKGKFVKKIHITTKKKDLNGNIITVKKTYSIKGEIVK